MRNIIRNTLATISRILLGIILVFPVICMYVIITFILTVTQWAYNFIDKLSEKTIDFVWYITNKIYK